MGTSSHSAVPVSVTTSAPDGTCLESFYRRELPPSLVPFASETGRKMFKEAIVDGTMESYFPLAEQFVTQSEPAFCAVSTLAMCLNAFAIDPETTWKHPWRWYSEDMLECCTPLGVIKQSGLTLNEFAGLSRCHNLIVDEHRADLSSIEHFRESVKEVSRHSTLRGLQSALVIAYSRTALDQTGEGHMSPIGGFHIASDSVLVLDVARFKYPPYWVTIESLWRAMLRTDPVTNLPRGYCKLSRSLPDPKHCESCSSQRTQVSGQPPAVSSCATAALRKQNRTAKKKEPSQ